MLAKQFVEHHMHIRFTQNPVAVGIEHVKGEYICVKKGYVCKCEVVGRIVRADTDNASEAIYS